MSIDALLSGVSVYQDVVLDGRTVRRGARDCPARWQLLDAHLPRAGAILDVGSNFGWFGLQICQSRRECVVASVEADLGSAEVQRAVLESNGCHRICLLTERAGTRMVERMARAGQRFDAVLCLAVLHWMADHRRFLASLGRIAGRILIEQPNPEEQGAGVTAIRREIGAAGPYLAGLFPDRPVQRVAQLPSHRDAAHARELWLVAEPSGWPAEPSPGLNVEALADCHPGWPAQSWWQQNLPPGSGAQPDLLFTPRGLAGTAGPALRRRLRCIPEKTAFAPGRRLRLRVCRAAGNALRSLAAYARHERRG